MAEYITLSDYSIKPGRIEGVFSDKEHRFEAVYLKNIRKSEIFKEVNMSKENDTYVFSFNAESQELAGGTWYPVMVDSEGNEFFFRYNDIVNNKDVGIMLELSEKGLYCNPETKIHYMAALDADSLFSIRKWKNKLDYIKKGTFIVKKYDNTGDEIILYPKKCSCSGVLQAEIWLWSRSLKKIHRIPVDVNQLKGKSFRVSLSDFFELEKENFGKLWEIFLVINSDGKYIQNRIEMRKGSGKKGAVLKVDVDESERYVMSKELDGQTVFQVYFDQLSKMCAKVISKEALYKGMYRGEVRDIKMKNGILYIAFNYNRKEFVNKRLMLRHYSEIDNKLSEYFFETTEEEDVFRIDMSLIEWTPLRYEMILLADKDNYTYEFRVVGVNENFRKKLSDMYKNSFVTKDGILVYMTETIGGKLIIECRKKNRYDNMKYRFNEFVSKYTAYIYGKVYPKNKVCMFYEKFCTAAQDNSYYMFEYFMKHKKEGIVPIYVLEKDSPDYKSMKKKYGKNVVTFMGIRHLSYIRNAKVFVSTDSKRHCYRWRSGNTRIMQIIARKKFVFLQHGVVGFKRVDNIYGKKFANKADLFIASSDFEKDIIERNFGYNKKEIIVTGLARWDKLEDKSQDDNMIFYMPTWRNWIYEEENSLFEQTDYYKKYCEIINSDRIIDILEKKKTRMVFCLHPKFKQYSPMFSSKSDRIEIVEFGKCRINEMIMKCKMLITDYSSISWDVLYMEKPVLFYQFDCEKYMEKQGTYINFDKEVFGERATSFEEFAEKLENIIDNGYIIDSDKVLIDKYLPLRDKSNCKRIYKHVMSLIAGI